MGPSADVIARDAAGYVLAEGDQVGLRAIGTGESVHRLAASAGDRRAAGGARPLQVVRAIARQFTVPVVCGAVLGSGLAAGVGGILSRELFGVSGLDPLAHGGALLLFALVAAAAAAPSLRRALRVDPIAVLRHE